MKHLAIILTLIFSSLLVASSAHADWKEVAESSDGDIYFLDFDRIRKNGSYVYYWYLKNYSETSPYGDLSTIRLTKGDCEMFRYKSIISLYYTQPMGGGSEVSEVSKSDWVNPSRNSVSEGILQEVCLSTGYKDETVESFHENGQLKQTEIQRNGLAHGPVYVYHENGQLKIKANFINGIQNGPSDVYSANGQLQKKFSYKDGKVHGQVEEYYENGQLSTRFTSLEGEKNGLEERFYESGKAYMRLPYREGKLEGPMASFYENGKYKTRQTFNNDFKVGLEERFNEDGTLRKQAFHVDGMMTECKGAGC